MGILRKALGVMFADDATAPHVIAPRERLRAALAAVGPAEQKLKLATASVERVHAIIAAVEEAEEAAEEAERVAAAATRVWAESGAPGDAPSGDEVLLRAASEADRKAREAHFKATGAKAGLPAIVEAESAARIARDQARDEVKAAVTAMLLDEIEPQLAELEQIRGQYVEAMESIAALRELIRGWGSGHPWAPYSSSGASAELQLRLESLAIEVPDGSQLRGQSQEWAAFADRLRGDPDAQL